MTLPHRKYSSSDVPDYSSYPAEPGRSADSTAEYRRLSELDALPHSSLASYDEQGRMIGEALGRLVNRINEFTAPVLSKVSEKFDHLSDEAVLARGAAERSYADASHKVAEAAHQAVLQARTRAAELGRRASQTVDSYPVQTLVAAGVAGILLGTGLRVWNENRRRDDRG